MFHCKVILIIMPCHHLTFFVFRILICYDLVYQYTYNIPQPYNNQPLFSNSRKNLPIIYRNNYILTHCQIRVKTLFPKIKVLKQLFVINSDVYKYQIVIIQSEIYHSKVPMNVTI